MAFLTTTSPAADRFIGALCNTLVHSLWQGLVLATVTGLIVLTTRKSTAALRYNLLIAALALFAVGVGITFAVQFAQAQPLVTNAASIVNENVSVIRLNIVAPHQSLIKNVFGYLNQHHNGIVMVWFLIICAKSIQLIVGLLGVHRLKHTHVNQVSLEWYNNLQELAAGLEIKKKIVLLESKLAKVPMMIGSFKPVILIPIGLLTALSTEEVEAILVHELAHIKRGDYLVNLLQNLMEIIFFFNPAILWISQLIKAERENCCDDLALAQSSNKVNYIRALVSCEEYQSAAPAYAMAFAGGKNTLINRVKRIAGSRNHTLNLFEKTALAICLVVSGLCMSAFSQKENIHRITNVVTQVFSHIEMQKLKPAKPVVLLSETTKLAQQARLLKDNSSKAHALNADVLTTDINNNQRKRTDSSKMDLNIKLDSIKSHLGTIDIHLNNDVNVDSKENITVTTNPKADVMIDTPKTSAKINRIVVYHANGQVTNDPDRPYNANMNLNTSIPAIPVSAAPRWAVSGFSASIRDTTKKQKIVIDQANKTIYTSKKLTVSHDRGVDASDLANALYDAHLIKDKKNYKFTLTNDEMIVNGVKQPENIHQAFLKRYVKKQGDNVDVTIAVTNSN